MPYPQARQRAEPDLLELVAVGVLALAALIFALPVLLVALPLAFAIDERAWPRWPIFFMGAGATAAIVAPPALIWRRQALILGETGSGKTVTAQVLAAETVRLGWDVYWVDGKADRETARGFLGAARGCGVEAKDGFTEALDGWRGGP